MWVERKRSWIVTVVLGGFALPRIWGRTLAVTAIGLLVVIVRETVPWLHYSITPVPFTIVGLPLGIFLGFRNNSAYDRFWEGRKLWGALVNTSRSLTRQILSFIEPAASPAPAAAPESRDLAPPEIATEAASPSAIGMVHLLIAYAHALRHHLRDTDPFETLARILPPEEVERLRHHAGDNVPLAILGREAEHLAAAYRERRIHAMHVPIFEGSLVSLTDIQGACERIKSTPVPYSYTVLMHRIVAAYCTLLPLGLMDSVQWATPVVVLAISYCFFGLDAIGDELEQPFGLDPNDLPLESISGTIERNLRRMIGEKPAPPVAPRRGVLL